jgi:neutral amino acid transport system permease protein
MEAHTVETSPRLPAPRRLAAAASAHAPATTAGIVALIFVVLLAVYGLGALAQATANGLVTASYFALGAVGLTLVYGILKLVNFAHGDLLTFGAYMAFVANVALGLPLVAAIVFAFTITAALGVATELTLWRPMRARGAGLLQLLLIAIGLAFILRNGIQFFASTQPRSLRVDVVDSVSVLGVRIGQTELLSIVVGFAVLLLVGLMLRYTSLGRQMRALSDDFDLAEVTGIDTGRVVIYTWILSAGLAGLAGVLYAAALGTMTPNLGFLLLLSLFAAVILGGIGNAYGALAGGVVLGLVQEWSTLFIAARWKVAVGFVILILVLIVRPQGIFGRERTR